MVSASSRLTAGAGGSVVVYALSGYSAMIADRVRVDAHVAALAQSVQRDDVVVDLGAGSGYFAFEALRLGARHVHAIEPSEALVVAERIAKQNGLHEKITFHRALSTEVTLPERADVVIADLRGGLPLLGRNVQAIADARQRFLRKGGTLIPVRDVLSCAVVSAPKPYTTWLDIFSERAGTLDLTPARELLANRTQSADLDDTTALSSSAPVFTIDYHRAPTTRFSGTAELHVSAPGTGHALHVFFDATLTEGIRYTTGRAQDGERAVVYGAIFLPWPKPVTLDVDDRVTVTIRADLVDDEVIWSWDTVVTSAHGVETSRSRQSTFFGRILATDALAKQAQSYIPKASEQARVDVDVIEMLGSGRTQAEMAHALRARHPSRFASEQAALAHVMSVARRYET